MNRPICLWMTSRSRSSLVSKIFANHGVWWGNTYAKTKGYEMYENQVIKQIQKKFIKPSKGVLPHCEELQLTEEDTKPFHEALKEHHSKDCPKRIERWSMKTGVEYFNAWKDLNPYNIFIQRDPVGVANSIVQKGIGEYQHAFDCIQWRYNYMHRIHEVFGGVFINTDVIISGNYEDVEEAMEYCGIEYDVKAVESAIDR
jgi:hypothetical protein